ncbi:hypothetical protein K493DRAFT_310516 [Basidiobolus meristosporus CBS 931.73]|uniref:Uncharacterized protein n=1 Tax=Basidiobolus meristosporus CBS 931.73 TaxID=1314790 RepID=A0A1Y1Z8I8_9FUNG|nr:hypothetical protein K493DRAFT_310516 [Basidiobolus meristosporus CBS 931.73]|eukprot:ORY06573.1 hypothetical protein K493DRAFT_310516 [Basidiobolus meristosporus CBS 931.73]
MSQESIQNNTVDNTHESVVAQEQEPIKPQEQEVEKAEEEQPIETTPSSPNNANLEVVNRICGIPMVQDSINAVKSFVENSESRYVHLVADTAGSAMHTVAGLMQPVQTRFHSQIEQADQLGCRSLDFIETKVPIIKKPTNEVVQSCRSTVEPYIHTVEPYLEGVTSSAQNLVQNVRSIVQGK